MVKVDGPMLSQDARGSVGTAVNFSKNGPVNYARKIPRPANPKTASQVSARAPVAFLSNAWHSLSLLTRETWELSSPPSGSTPYSRFVAANLDNWAHTRAPHQTPGPPGSGQASLAPAVTVTPGPHHNVLTLPDSVFPVDWGYAIYRSIVDRFRFGRYDLIAFILRTPPVTTYLDVPLLPGTTYYYVTRGFFATGQWGAVSPQQSGTPT